jgi:hypothetical protein
MQVQLDLFEEELTDVGLLRKQVETLNDRLDRQRKSLFAKHAELMKLVIKQSEEMDRLRELMVRRTK